MKELRNLITNTTSLVGYIAVLMFVGAYVGGDQHSALDPTLLKGSVMEGGDIAGRDTPWHVSPRPVIITIDGRQYEATIRGESGGKEEYRY